MKKYKFKMDAILKLKEFNEEKAKIELGKVNKKIMEIDSKIEQHLIDIETAYTSQDEVLKSGADGRFLQFYPFYTQAKQQTIIKLKQDRVELMKEVQIRLKELVVCRNEVKVFEKLKEKDFSQWKKAINKEQDQKIEENVQLWLQNKPASEP